MIIAEIGDFNRFDSPDKIIGRHQHINPTTDGAYAHMEKRGSDTCDTLSVQCHQV